MYFFHFSHDWINILEKKSMKKKEWIFKMIDPTATHATSSDWMLFGKPIDVFLCLHTHLLIGCHGIEVQSVYTTFLHCWPTHNPSVDKSRRRNWLILRYVMLLAFVWVPFFLIFFFDAIVIVPSLPFWTHLVWGWSENVKVGALKVVPARRTSLWGCTIR